MQARAEVEKCAMGLEYFAEHAEAMLAAQPAQSTGSRSYVAFRPLGVCSRSCRGTFRSGK